MAKKYGKLVRDRIPEIISSNGEIPITRILGDGEYKKELELKLEEECAEVLASFGEDRKEELADLLEVLSALAKLENCTLEDITKIAEKKVQTRGAFEKKIYLENVINYKN